MIDFKKRKNVKTNKCTESKHKIAKKYLDMYFLEFHYVSYLNMTTFL